MFLNDVPKLILKTLIRIYAYAVSPLMGAKCRFYPTCSAYAIEAIEKHGGAKGSIMATKRLMKCHPWHRGDMIDPVPASIDWKGVIGYNLGQPEHGCECHKDKKDKIHAES